MDVKINDISENKKEIKVSLPPKEVEKYSDKAVELVSSETKIDGFRPGKAPKEVVEEKVGKERVWKEMCYQALRETYPKIIEENNFFVVSPPEVNVESMEINSNLDYKITVTILSQINLPEYKKIGKEIAKEKKEVKVDEEEVKKTLSSIQNSRAKTRSVSRPLQKGDEITITFEGLINGIKQEGLKGEQQKFIIGEQKFIEGFEENLIGLKPGEESNFSINMKNQEKEGNQKVDFQVKINDVKEREIPELNDEFASSLGSFSNLNDLHEKVKNNIKFEKELKEKDKNRIKIIDTICEKTKIEIPKEMVEKELDNMIAEYKEQLSKSGLSFDNYLSQIKKTEEDVRSDWYKRAEKRLMASLILSEIAKKEKIEVTDEEVEKETSTYLNRLREQNAELPDYEKLKLYIKDIIQNEKVFQLLEG